MQFKRKGNLISSIAMFIFYVALCVGLMMGLWWLLWSLWTWVVPQVYPQGPEVVIRPSYWLFVGCLFLGSIIGRVIFGSKK